MLGFGGKTGLRTCARPDFIGFNGKFEHSRNNDKIKTKNYKPEIKSKIRPQRQRTAGHYITYDWICQALFFRQIAQKNLGGQSEVFCSFCFTG